MEVGGSWPVAVPLCRLLSRSVTFGGRLSPWLLQIETNGRCAAGLSRSVTSNGCFGSYLLQIEMFGSGAGECLDL